MKKSRQSVGDVVHHIGALARTYAVLDKKVAGKWAEKGTPIELQKPVSPQGVAALERRLGRLPPSLVSFYGLTDGLSLGVGPRPIDIVASSKDVESGAKKFLERIEQRLGKVEVPLPLLGWSREAAYALSIGPDDGSSASERKVFHWNGGTGKTQTFRSFQHFLEHALSLYEEQAKNLASSAGINATKLSALVEQNRTRGEPRPGAQGTKAAAPKATAAVLSVEGADWAGIVGALGVSGRKAEARPIGLLQEFDTWVHSDGCEQFIEARPQQQLERLAKAFDEIGDSSAAQRTRQFAHDASQWRKGAMRSDDLEKAAKKIDNWWDKHHKKALAIARKRAGALLRDS